jgi:hypothetical protein
MSFVGKAVQGITNTIFGSNKGSQQAALAPAQGYRPYNFSSGGYTGTLNPNTNTYNLTSNPFLTNALAGLKSAYGTANSNLASLLPQVQAGTGLLTNAAANAFNLARTKLGQARQAAIGNLQQNLSNRRMLGSSFADNALSNANADWAQSSNDLASQEAQTQAQNYLQELNATHQLMTEQNNNNVSSAQDLLNQLNAEGNLGAQMASGLSGISANNAQLQSQLIAQMNAQNQANRGGIIGLGSGLVSQIL